MGFWGIRQTSPPSSRVVTAAVSDSQLPPAVRHHHILRAHRQCRAGWIRIGLSGNVYTTLLLRLLLLTTAAAAAAITTANTSSTHNYNKESTRLWSISVIVGFSGCLRRRTWRLFSTDVIYCTF